MSTDPPFEHESNPDTFLTGAFFHFEGGPKERNFEELSRLRQNLPDPPDLTRYQEWERETVAAEREARRWRGEFGSSAE